MIKPIYLLIKNKTLATILLLETSTTACSVGLSVNGKVIAIKELNEGYTHAENLTPFIQSVLGESQTTISAIDAIAISKGPGSYTGLRIGVSTAKGLCYSLNKPLIALETLKALALQTKTLLPKIDENSLFCPMLDARRMEVYCAVYNNQLDAVETTTAKIIDEKSFISLLNKHEIYFFGDGAEKCKTIITHPNAKFILNIFPSATYMAEMAENKYKLNTFEDVAYFEPFYLKDFIAGPSKK